MFSQRLTDADRQALSIPATDDASKERVVVAINEALLDEAFYDETAFLGVPLSKLSKSKLSSNQLRMKPIDRRRMNRSLLEDAMPELINKHDWNTPGRRRASGFSLWGNANFALMLAAICAMFTLKRIRSLSWRSLGDDVEEALMSGGVIILITAAGGAFGAMLQDTHISDTIKNYFTDYGASGIALLLLGWGIAAVLKVAQGSSTVAMIIGAGMMSAIIGQERPDFHMVYVATAVGTGSLMGSWMNDSGFWIFTKMGGLIRRRVASKLDTVANDSVDRWSARHDRFEFSDANESCDVREPPLSGSAAGCLYGLVVAVVTGAMLFINGSIVLVFVKALAQSGSALASRKDVAQLLLLTVPVVMVVVEWKLIDYLWRRIPSRSNQ